MLDYDTVINWPFPDVVQDYTTRDTMLYALGLGYGQNPADPAELRFVYEDGLCAAPTMPVVLGNPGAWMRDPRTGIDWVKSLHGEQGLKIFAPLPAQGSVIGRNRVTGVVDKGPGRGALLMMERDIVDTATGALLATRTSTSFLRGDGGCGAPAASDPPPPPVPARAPDIVHAIATRPEAALIYRLSGDYNPVHADPKIAAKAGFARPILHGLCTFGVIGRALVATACAGDPARLRGLAGRFSAPIYPGETIETQIWTEPDGLRFQARCVERDVVVFKNGTGKTA
ncbi:MAG: MaoC family dehydratase N-terminal domain-containing protein [Alphaproteobacteria bacterium]|nr:MaoC family dehydratase N-terminal domain-containing protein [Alphaproteobacteria bacterium]